MIIYTGENLIDDIYDSLFLNTPLGDTEPLTPTHFIDCFEDSFVDRTKKEIILEGNLGRFKLTLERLPNDIN